MKIHLKRNEKLFLNGAVVMLDRRGTIELLNDAQFLLQSHVMQQEDAKRPLEQTYFIVQSMLMDPANALMIQEVYCAYSSKLKSMSGSRSYLQCIEEVDGMVNRADYFGALKLLRKSFSLDDSLGRPATKMQQGVAA